MKYVAIEPKQQCKKVLPGKNLTSKLAANVQWSLSVGLDVKCR